MTLSFGDKLKEARKAKKLTQKKLAEKIGAKHNSISDWENNKNKPDPDTIEILCGVLDITPNYLLATASDEFSPAEKLLIKNYRQLDTCGKMHIDTVLDWELQRLNSELEQKNRIVKLELANLPKCYMSYYQRLASAGSGEYLFNDVPTDTIEVPVTVLSNQADFAIGVNGDSMEPTYHDGDRVYIQKMTDISTGSIGLFTRGNECFIKELGSDRLISHNKAYDDIPASDDIRLVGKVLGRVDEFEI